jgi:hypothetical protein
MLSATAEKEHRVIAAKQAEREQTQRLAQHRGIAWHSF